MLLLVSEDQLRCFVRHNQYQKDNESDFEYCHKDIVGKILRKTSVLILFFFVRTNFLNNLLLYFDNTIKKKEDSRR